MTKQIPPSSTSVPAMSQKKLEAKFYMTEAENSPPLNWIFALSKDDRKLVGQAIRHVEWTWPVPPPLVKKLTKYLWEIRETISNLNEARILFIVDVPYCVLLHGFEKKAQKTPQQDIDTAEIRRKDYIRQKTAAAKASKKPKT
jgi:phage-related protein